MEDCLFCKIIAGEIPSNKVYEKGNVIGFRDLYPQAKEHLLFIHKNHTTDVNEISSTDPAQLAEVFSAINEYTNESGLSETGFRVVTNKGPHGCQSVFHTHFHVLGGEQLGSFGK